MLKQKNRIKRGFSPLYLAVFSGILLVILIINGVLEIDRTRKGFHLLLEREATVLLQQYEKDIQDILASLQLLEKSAPGLPASQVSSLYGLEESVAEYLVDAAHRIDQIDRDKPLGPDDLRSLANQYLLASIGIYDPMGHRIKGWPAALPPGREPQLRELTERRRSVVIDLFGKPLSGEGQPFSIAIWRQGASGIVSLQLDSGQMRKLLYLFAVQRTISDIGLREGVLYVSVQDPQFNFVAHTNSGLIGKREEDPFLKDLLRAPGPFSRLRDASGEENVFEVAKSFSFRGDPMGIIRVGYSTQEIHTVLRQTGKTVALSISFFLILGISAIALIWTNQNRHLQRMKEMEDRVQLAERLSSLGHLAAGVAHEIRNPLNAMGMGIQRLKREFAPHEESKRDEFLSFTELILKEVRRVNQIIEQFLTLSRPFQLNLKESSPRDLLTHLVTLFREEAASLGIRLEAEIDSNLPPVWIDEEKLTQALINIMKNGIQAMEQAMEQRRLLRLQARASRDRLEIKISDSGAGIAPDQMEKIFNYYYTTKEKGVGLGLPIAHRIIEAHQGQLDMESQPGAGTTVTVILPVKPK